MKKRAIYRFLAAGMAFLMLAGAGCGKGGKKPESEETADPNILTHVFRETAKTSEKARMTHNVVPSYDRETGTLVYLCQTSEEYGEDTLSLGYSIRTLSADGEESVTADFALTDARINGGFAEPDGITCGLYSQDGSGNRRAVIGHYDAEKGEWTSRTDDILSLFAARPAGMRGPVRDAAGQWIVASESTAEILVLSAEGKKLRSVMPDDPGAQITSLAASEDGRIYACFDMGGRCRIAQVFTEEGKLGALEDEDAVLNILPGTDGVAYWTVSKTGIWGRKTQEDGGETEMLLHFLNSGITWSQASPISVSPDAVFFYEIPPGENVWDGGYITANVPGGDIDLRDIRYLNIAYFDSLPNELTAAINSFNRSRPDARIVAEDWSVYGTGENPFAGYDKLLRDMVTGTGSPDILVGGLAERHIVGAYEQGLYTDLTPFLSADGTVNPDNLFGCVKRLFDDGRGGMWGISPNFRIADSLVSTPELLGEYAEKGYWTISEALDYIESLPADCAFMAELTQTGLPLLDGGDGYMIFVDREAGTCSFDGPEFVRWLNFVKSLPTREEYAARSSYGSMNAEELAKLRLDGKIRAASTGTATVGRLRQLLLEFGTKDWTLIGYPAPVKRAGAGTPVTAEFALMISSACESPELAWDLIRRCFTAEGEQGGIPALKTSFDKAAELLYEKQFEDYYIPRADAQSQSYDKKYADPEKKLKYPGYVSTFDPEDRDKYAALFDEIGTSPSERGIPEVRGIIGEELSSFLGGVGSAEDCAKKIQSRVSIWLAENQ